MHAACCTGNLAALRYLYSDTADAAFRQEQQQQVIPATTPPRLEWGGPNSLMTDGWFMRCVVDALIHAQTPVLRWLAEEHGTLTKERLQAAWYADYDACGDSVLAEDGQVTVRTRLIIASRRKDADITALMRWLVLEQQLAWPPQDIMTADLTHWIHVCSQPLISCPSI